jgi:hypothetical protein
VLLLLMVMTMILLALDAASARWCGSAWENRLRHRWWIATLQFARCGKPLFFAHIFVRGRV